MQTMEAITTRRSVRQYQDRPVDRAIIDEIIAAAAYAPSWKNTQTAGYVVVTDPAARETIAAEMLPPYNARIVRSAPVLVAMTCRVGRSGFEKDGSFTTKKEDRWQYFDSGIACQTFCLAAHDLGLATVIMGIYDEDKLPAFLGLDDDHVLTALIALGYADNAPVCPKKRTVEELVRYV
jgi:nitroreductase